LPVSNLLHRVCTAKNEGSPDCPFGHDGPIPAAFPVTPTPLRTLLACLLLLASLGFGAGPAHAALLHLEGPVPTDLGLHDGHLSPCPSTAHCATATWPVADADDALAALLPVVLGLEGVEVVETGNGYLHATATSRIFGFVDDLELHADGEAGVIEARSVSRLGDSDLGVNARRLKTLERALGAG
jgi:uncharacterized protein (DUF1499 family)